MAHFDSPSVFDFDDPRVKLMLDRIAAKNVRVNSNHVAQSKTLQFIAEWYAGTYCGSYDFMRKMHAIINRGGAITNNQAAGVINCLVFDAKRRKPSKVEALPADLPAVAMPPIPRVLPTVEAAYESLRDAQDNDGHTGTAMRDLLYATVAERRVEVQPIAPAITNGTYTVVINERGDYRTLKIEDCSEKFNKPAGTQIASYLSGADNERDFTGCAFVAGAQVSMWSRFKTDSISAQALKILVSAPEDRQRDYGMAYALESGRCYRCGRTLTVPASIHRGLGPECSKKVGL